MSHELLFDIPGVSPLPEHLILTEEDNNDRLASLQLLRELSAAIREGMVVAITRHEQPTGLNSPLPTTQPTLSGNGKKRKAKEAFESELRRDRGRRQDLDDDAISFGRKEDEQPEGTGEVKPVEKASKSRHVKFGEDDDNGNTSKNAEQLILQLRAPNEVSQGGELGEDKSSEDEAPEAVTNAAGLEHSRSAAAKAAKTLERQDAALRAKRRNHDARLKAQAKSSKTKQRSETQSPAPKADAYGQPDHVQSKNSDESSKAFGRSGMPKFLPDDLLTTTPTIHTPEVSSQLNKQIVKKNKKSLLTETKPPKDIKHGNKRIRVLPAEQSVLPPRSSTKSKNVREAWLLGRRGVNGKASVPRKKMGGTFLRK